MGERAVLPTNGRSAEDILSHMREAGSGDVDWRNGRAAVYVFHPGDDVMRVAHDAYLAFISENGLGPAAFPSLAGMEREVVGMALGLQSAPDGADGSMTSGGTESILLAVKACRDRAEEMGQAGGRPNLVVPFSAHPAFSKAAHLFGLDVIRVPLTEDFRADPEAMAAAIDDNTIMLVGSAPCFPFGVTDPIEALGALALERSLWLHVDACVGGYLAPFVRAAGEPVDPWDFSIAGVQSMSADLHKYGYASKGASTVMYRDRELKRFQGFDFDDWPCGRMYTPTFAGTRPGGAIASAWAVLNYLGFEGYVDRARSIVSARRKLEVALPDMGMRIFGDPRLSIIAFGSDDLDILAVGEGLYEHGWMSSRTREPEGIQVMLSPRHDEMIDEYIDVLGRLAGEVRSGARKRRSGQVRYGG